MVEVFGQDKYILDATAGFRMMWFNKHDPNTLYIDARPECQPDEIQDYRKLPYPDRSFRLILFDPPHIIKSKQFGNYNSRMTNDFGYLIADNVEADLKDAFNEFWRLLKPYGVLIFKWNNSYVPSDKIIKLAPEKPLFYQVTHSKSGKTQTNHIKTLWFCFMKKPDSGIVAGKEKEDLK